MAKKDTEIIAVRTRIWGVWTFWLFWLLFLSCIAPIFLPYLNQSSNYVVQEVSQLPMWVERWANFDGGAYVMISRLGYGTIGLIEAYFPAYPLLIWIIFKILSIFLGSLTMEMDFAVHILIAINLSIFCSFAMLQLLRAYLQGKGHTSSEILQIILVMLLFPTSFFFISIYTESLFLLSVIGALYFYQKKQYLPLAITLAFVSFSRVVGVFLIPAIALDVLWKEYELNNFKLTQFFQIAYWKSLIVKEGQLISSAIVGTSGLLGYMSYLYYLKGDALYFFHVQSEFGAGREERIILLPQVIWRYLKIVWTVRPFDLKYYAYVQEFLMSLLVLGLLIYGVKHMKRLKLTVAELSFSFMAFILPTFTGNFSSMPRYILVCLPIYGIIASLVSRYRWGYYIVAAIWLTFNTILFIQGRWIA